MHACMHAMSVYTCMVRIRAYTRRYISYTHTHAYICMHVYMHAMSMRRTYVYRVEARERAGNTHFTAHFTHFTCRKCAENTHFTAQLKASYTSSLRPHHILAASGLILEA